MIHPLTIELIGHTDLDFIELIEHIQLGDGQAIQAVDLHRIAANHPVKPATAAPTARGGAVLAAAIAKVVREAALQLSGEGPLTDAGGVGLGNSDDAVDQGWANPSANAGTTSHRVGGRHIGIGAVIEIQQGALGPFKQDVFASPRGVMDGAGAIHHMAGEAAAVVGVFGNHLLGIEGLKAIQLLQLQVFRSDRPLQTLAQQLLIEQVDHAQTTALSLIGIGGADATAGGANALVAALLLHRLIEQAVIRERHVGGGGHLQATGVNVIAGQHRQLAQQHLGIDHRAGSDQAGGIGVKDSRGDQVQLEHLTIDNDGVPGVDTTLITHDDVSRAAEQIGDLSLALVTPLSTDDDNVGQSKGDSGPQSEQSAIFSDQPPPRQKISCRARR